jgi:tetratricopeptide (TPR) repeat protein
MVETQQGISTFLSFGAKSVKPEILEELLIGRRDDIDYLTKSVNEIVNDGANHQIIIVGQRGMGKTHLMRVLYERSRKFLKEEKLVIAYFSEEEYGIAGYLDFLIRILNAFIRWNDNDKASLELKMDVLRETHPGNQIDVAEKIIVEYVGSNPLLILAENFDTILNALGKDGQGKLRSFLYRHSRTSIIATSQALIADLGKEDRPFYNFFTTVYLKKLTYEDSLGLLRALAELEKKENVIEHLKGKGIAQVRAVHNLVKGNHRLLVTFYEFLKADTLAPLSKIFMKTLNDLKPYYETYIRFLPQQQQKILHYVALSKMPQNGTEIAKNCFIDSKTLSKQLSELSRKNLIESITDPDDKRNKLYDIAEPLLRISIEIGEHREGISALFIDFLALYYSFDELSQQKDKFQNLYESETNSLLKQDLWHDVIARDKAIDLKTQLEKNKKWSKAYLEMVEKYDLGDYEGVIEIAENVNDNEREDEYYFKLGFSYSHLAYFSQAIENYKMSAEIHPKANETWYNLGLEYIKIGNYEEAIKSLKTSIQLKPYKHNAWLNLGAIHHNLGDFKTAIESFKEVIKILPNDDIAWYNLGTSYALKKDFSKAVEAMKKAIEISPNLDNAWYNLGKLYFELKDYKNCIKTYKRTVEIKPSKFEAWSNLASILGDTNNMKAAISAHRKAVETGVNFVKNENWVLRETVYKNISQSIITILENSLNLTLKDFKHLENIISEGYGLPPELEIAYRYLQTYRRYVLEKDEKALLELPKEQRQFFVKEILGK